MRNKVQSNKVTKMDDAVFFRYSKQEDEEEEAEKIPSTTFKISNLRV